MSKFCIKCGTPLPDEAVFCTKCGSPQPSVQGSSPAQKAQPNKQSSQPVPPTQARAVQKTQQTASASGQVRQRAATPQQAAEQWNKEQRTAQEQTWAVLAPKKKGGCLKTLLSLVLVAALLYTGFVKPGFVMKWIREIGGDPGGGTGAVVIDPTLPETEPVLKPDPGDKVVLGSSKAVNASPCPGVTVTAPKNAFWKDTEVRMTPLTKADGTLLNTVAALEEEGYMAIAGWEVDAGLADDEVIPGSYSVTLDLKALGISEVFSDYLCVYRVADDGSYYPYASRVENGKLIYSADQNSITLLVVGDWILRGLIVTGIIYYGYPIVKNWYNAEFTAPMKYFYDAGKKMSELTCSNKYGSYTLRWAPADLGIDEEANMKKMEEISAKYRARAQELYKQYEEDKLFNASNILNIFSRNKTVDEVVLEAIQKDPEYLKLQKEINLPDTVDYAVGCIDMAYKYLKEEEYMKIPTNVVEITSTSAGGNLATAMSRKVKTPWVEINLGAVQNGGQAARDTFLVTMVHEMLHVCQRGYRYFWTDSVRYDEMTAIVVERRAALHFKSEGIIDWGSKMEMNPTSYWSTLKLPVDKYYAPDNSTLVMQHEGYNLGEFIAFLEERTGRIMWGGRMMNAISSVKEGGISAPIMKLFDLNPTEFATCYKLFIRANKNALSKTYRDNEKEYDPYPYTWIEKGKAYHTEVRPEGPYSSAIRGFIQKQITPMILLMVPDGGFASDLPDTQLLPADPFTLFTKGAYIPALSDSVLDSQKRHRNILELTAGLNNVGDRNGYYVYVLDKTKTPAMKEAKDDLVFTFPELSPAANTKVIDGFLLTIQTPGGGKIEKEISNSYFKKEYKLPKKDFFKDAEPNVDEIKLSFTLCEYVLTADGTKLMGEVSDPFSFTIHREMINDLAKFTDMWIPVQTPWEKIKPGDWVLGLIYLEEDNEFGEYEGYYDQWNTAKSRWLEIKYFDYDPKTGVLTIDFDKNAPGKATGTATYRINSAGHLEMTNSGGTFEFYRAPKN